MYTRAVKFAPRRARALRRGGSARAGVRRPGGGAVPDEPEAGSSPPRTSGSSAPDNRALTLADFKGKVVFLNFWATWCKPCEEEMPGMERLYQKYKDKGLVVLAISEDADGAGAVAPFVKKHGLTFPSGSIPRCRWRRRTACGHCPPRSSSTARAIAPTSPMARASGTARRPGTLFESMLK